jgi:hypothetical protein
MVAADRFDFLRLALVLHGSLPVFFREGTSRFCMLSLLIVPDRPSL